MKRLLAIICVLVCLCGLCVPAFAANDSYTIHADVPDEWATAYVWAWNDNQQNAFNAWPGQKLTKDADGYYTGSVPSGYTNLVIAEKDGGAQTIDINGVEPKELWIVLGQSADGKYYDYSMGYSKDSIAPPADVPSTPVEPSEPAKLNSLAIVGEGIPGVKNWIVEDPAGDMTKVEENVYTKVIAVTAGTTMKFKIAGNDTWDDTYNFGAPEDGTPVTVGSAMDMTVGGGSKNYALTADKDCNLKFTVKLGGDVPTLLVEETTEAPETAPSTPSGEMITVYAKFPDDWTDVRVWAWDDTIGDADPSGWPGTFVMTEGANGWYSVQIPNWVTGVLLNANGASTQTTDLVIEAGKDIWINARTDVSQPTVHYEEVEVADPEPTEPPTIATRPIVRPTEPAGTNDTKAPADNTVLFCVIGSVVVIGIAAAVYFILSKKKQ